MKAICFSFLLMTCAAANAQQQLKILSYNIYHGEQGYKKGEPSIDDIAHLINEVKPDLVAFQEIDSLTGRSGRLYSKRINLIEELAAKTKMYGFFGKAMDYDSGGYGEGLLSRKPSSAAVQVLPNPAGGEPRSLIYITYPLKNNKQLVFAGTHLCHQYTANKIAQVQTINRVLSEKKQPVILCGDFNFISTDEPYTLLTPSWLDAAAVKGNEEFTCPSDKPEGRIDYVWLKKNIAWKVIEAKVLPYIYSDHKPVLVTVEIL